MFIEPHPFFNQATTSKRLEVVDNKAEQNCAAKAYRAYVEQAIAVPTQLGAAYNRFAKTSLTKLTALTAFAA